jgi:hypothetical protein
VIYCKDTTSCSMNGTFGIERQVKGDSYSTGQRPGFVAGLGVASFCGQVLGDESPLQGPFRARMVSLVDEPRALPVGWYERRRWRRGLGPLVRPGPLV